MFTDYPTLAEQLKAGKLRALATGSRTRAEALPDVPTVAESGYTRGVPDHLCASALQALAKSFSEFQENTFVVRIAELRLGPLPHGTFRFENTLFHSPTPDRQRLILFAEHGLEEGFNQYVHRYLHHEAAGTQSAPTPALAPALAKPD
jgi:hypothetical protein